MNVKLSLKEKKVKLVLLNEEDVIDEENWIDENNLLEKFFPIFDDMLKRNNIDIDNINNFELDTSIPSGYTTARIATTIIKTLNFAQKI